MRQSAGELQPLKFAAGEILPVLQHPGSEILRFLFDPFLDLRIPGSYDHLIILNGIIPHPDIVIDRIVKHNGFLIHGGHR